MKMKCFIYCIYPKRDDRFLETFFFLFVSLKGLLNWYTSESMDETEFLEAESNINDDLVSSLQVMDAQV